MTLYTFRFKALALFGIALPGVVLFGVALLVTGCNSLPPGKPLASLTPGEAAGRVVFVSACARCHNAYSTEALHGPSLYGVFRKPYLTSGAPARDDRVMEVILHGRNLMPAAGADLTEQQLQDLLRYLHTL